MIRKLINEPLVQFGLLGALLFVLFSFMNPEESNNKIIIDEYDINEIASKWRLQWQREPTSQELKGLLDNYIKQEIYYREALEMNLDHNDEVIRRRLFQKMQFLTQDLVESTIPTDEELERFMEESQEKYMSEPKYSFRHLYFSPDKRTDPKKDAEQAILNPSERYDNLPVRLTFEEVESSRIRAELGQAFTHSLQGLEENNEWQGPVQSGFGYHLVLLTSVIPASPLKLQDIKEKVIGDYQYDLQERVNEELFESLLEKYEVVLKIDEEQIKTEAYE